MSSEIDICNTALSFLGDSADIASLNPDEESAQAQLCKRLYEPALKTTLEVHPWSFATVTVRREGVLAEQSPTWSYYYELPSELLMLQALYPATSSGERASLAYGVGQVHLIGTLDYELGYLDGHRIVYANAPRAVLRYTSMNVNPEHFPGSFTLALAYRLASLLAGQRIGGEKGVQLQKHLMRQAELATIKARNEDSRQRQGSGEFVPSWIEVR